MVVENSCVDGFPISQGPNRRLKTRSPDMKLISRTSLKTYGISYAREP